MIVSHVLLGFDWPCHEYDPFGEPSCCVDLVNAMGPAMESYRDEAERVCPVCDRLWFPVTVMPGDSLSGYSSRLEAGDTVWATLADTV